MARDYLISARTCSVEDADNDDSYIYLTINGSTGRLNNHHLHSPSRDDFETGATDVYRINAPNLGTIRNMIVRISGNDGWCFEWIKVTDVATGANWRVTYNAFIDGDSEWPPIVYCPLEGRHEGVCSAQ
ncbi:PLAT/LH2 domain-containing protein [Polyangium sp. y55x31]|uniref:PLAT/LH2 domain-containing protein n=1 Tax=Polyangium sp. y55x31 TaxID=3042688 RepID=UPI0024830281|nr:PLAT/LH2 domain-containing protein [Polyangium sp. y55x31]MDI1476809.1 PLAT/LH2 domain-containing protein [Polyangium sp. y55x31]